MPETTQVKAKHSPLAEQAAAIAGMTPATDNRPRFKTVTLATGARVRLKRQYLDGTIVPDRREQIAHGTCELIDATRFLELRVVYTDDTPAEVWWIPWAQVGQVEPMVSE